MQGRRAMAVAGQQQRGNGESTEADTVNAERGSRGTMTDCHQGRREVRSNDNGNGGDGAGDGERRLRERAQRLLPHLTCRHPSRECAEHAGVADPSEGRIIAIASSQHRPEYRYARSGGVMMIKTRCYCRNGIVTAALELLPQGRCGRNRLRDGIIEATVMGHVVAV